MYLVVILMVGTKTPLLVFCITLGLSLAYFWIQCFKKKEYKKASISLGVIGIGIISLLVVLPHTNFYKNIETHLDFLELKSIKEVFEKKEYIDHFIFSQRLTFLETTQKRYHNSNRYLKVFGIGYLDGKKEAKRIEMDYFDIFYSQGIIGFIIVITVTIWIFIKIIKEKKKRDYEEYMTRTSLFFIFLLSFFTGHILTSPSVCFISIIIILSLLSKEKERILIIGDKEELKKQDNYKVFLQKPISNKRGKFLLFKILNYKNYDYSYSKEKNDILAEIASNHVLTKKEMQEL